MRRSDESSPTVMMIAEEEPARRVESEASWTAAPPAQFAPPIRSHPSSIAITMILPQPNILPLLVTPIRALVFLATQLAVRARSTLERGTAKNPLFLHPPSSPNPYSFLATQLLLIPPTPITEEMAPGDKGERRQR